MSEGNVRERPSKAVVVVEVDVDEGWGPYDLQDVFRTICQETTKRIGHRCQPRAHVAITPVAERILAVFE